MSTQSNKTNMMNAYDGRRPYDVHEVGVHSPLRTALKYLSRGLADLLHWRVDAL